jgi:putative transposase
MNSIIERWLGSVRRECLDRLLMTGEGHFPKVLGEYERHYNQHRPHRSRDRQPPQPPQPAVAAAKLDRARLKREEVPNGLINEYRRAA